MCGGLLVYIPTYLPTYPPTYLPTCMHTYIHACAQIHASYCSLCICIYKYTYIDIRLYCWLIIARDVSGDGFDETRLKWVGVGEAWARRNWKGTSSRGLYPPDDIPKNPNLPHKHPQPQHSHHGFSISLSQASCAVAFCADVKAYTETCSQHSTLVGAFLRALIFD